MIPTKSLAGIFPKAVVASCGIALFSSMLAAAPITGGMTTVALDSSTLATLESLFTIGTVPPTMLTTPGDVPTVNFPITGGDTSTGIIDHSGGLTLTGEATPTGIGTEVWTANYVINLNTAMLTSEVSVNGGTPMMNVPLFDIGAGDVLTVDKALAGDLSTIFGLPNLTGATVGTATVSPSTATPEPASFALASAGLLAALLFAARKKSLL